MTETEHTFVFAELVIDAASKLGGTRPDRISPRFHEIVRRCVPSGTRLVKTICDAVMIVSPSMIDGLSAALALGDSASKLRLPDLRIGLHAGPAAEHRGDFSGDTVDLAARLSDLAGRGEIVCTEQIAGLAIRNALAHACPIGTARLRNMPTPVALYRLLAKERAGVLCHIDPVCGLSVTPDQAPVQTLYAGATFYFCSLRCAVKFKEAPEVHVLVAGQIW